MSTERGISKRAGRIKKFKAIKREHLYSAVVTDVVLGIYTEEVKERIAVCEINRKASVFDDVEGSLNDNRLGTIGGGIPCAHCGLSVDECGIGHPGRIVLYKPCFNSIFIRLVIDIITTRCFECAIYEKIDGRKIYSHTERILSQNIIENSSIGNVDPIKRLKKISDLSKKETCQKCNSRSSYIFKKIDSESKGFILYTYKKDKKERPMYAEEILSMLKSIPPEDAEMLNFPIVEREINGEIIMTHKLDALIYESVLVPPKPTRPHPQYAKNTKKSDYNLLEKIIEKNINVGNSIRNRGNDLYEKIKELYSSIKDFSDELNDKLGGKEGMLRRVFKKPVNFSARATITNDPSREFATVTIPEEMSYNLTPSEYVNNINYEYIYLLLLSGHVSKIKKSDGRLININPKFLPNSEEEIYNVLNSISDFKYRIEFGDIVYRHLANEDPMIYNRQPTLHRHSIGSVLVRLWGEITIGFRPLEAGPLNADFDGDQLTLHQPQTERELREARNEIYIMNNFKSTKNGNINFGAILDNIEAVYLISYDNNLIPQVYIDMAIKMLRFHYETNLMSELLEDEFDITDKNSLYEKLNVINKFYGFNYKRERKDYIDIVEHVKNWRKNLHKYGIHQRSPRALLSLAFPNNFTYIRDGISIIDGIFVSGIMKKNHVGIAQSPVTKYMLERHLVTEVSSFLDNLVSVTNVYLNEYRGFSISPHDYDFMMKKDLTSKLQNIYKNLEDEIIEIERRFKDNQIFRVKSVLSSLNSHDTLIRKLVKMSQTIDNQLYIAKESGGKGNDTTNVQSVANTGQTFISNQLPKELIGERISPYYKKGEISLSALGYSVKSYFEGLLPKEHFTHYMAGRISQISNVLTTPSVGDFSRILSRYMAGLITEDDGTVRANNFIVQFFYAPYGFDTRELFHTPMDNDSEMMFFIDLIYESILINKERGFHLVPKSTIILKQESSSEVKEHIEIFTEKNALKYIKETEIDIKKYKNKDSYNFIKEEIYFQDPLVKYENKNKIMIDNTIKNITNFLEFRQNSEKLFDRYFQDPKIVIKKIFNDIKLDDENLELLDKLLDQELNILIFKEYFKYLKNKGINVKKEKKQVIHYIDESRKLFKYFFDLTNTLMEYHSIENLIEIKDIVKISYEKRHNVSFSEFIPEERYNELTTVEQYVNKNFNDTYYDIHFSEYVSDNINLFLEDESKENLDDYLEELRIYFRFISLKDIIVDINIWFVNIMKYIYVIDDLNTYTKNHLKEKFERDIMDIDLLSIKNSIFQGEYVEEIEDLLFDTNEDYIEALDTLKLELSENFIYSLLENDKIDNETENLLINIFGNNDTVDMFITIAKNSIDSVKIRGFPFKFMDKIRKSL